MLKSMTGYGRAEKVFENYTISLELKAVNHRFFEFTPKVPRGYAFLEEPLKAFVQRHISRGKLDAYFTVQSTGAEDVKVEINWPLASGYAAALQSLADAFCPSKEVSLADLSRFGDIFSVAKSVPDEDALRHCVLKVADEALQALIAMRETEGAKLLEDFTGRLQAIEEKITFVEAQSPKTVSAYRERLEQKIKELLGDTPIDEQRLLTETAIFADKIAVSEETVRLRSHIKQFRALLVSDAPVGRKLDFLVQEMNREANTIGSKAQDIAIAHTVVDLKAEIEKIREQVQNIE